MPVPDVGSSAARRGSKYHSLLKARIPWPQGKTQGIYPIPPFLAKICLENGCEFSGLRVNSYTYRAGNFFASAGNYSRGQGMAGNFAQDRSARPDASDNAKMAHSRG